MNKLISISIIILISFMNCESKSSDDEENKRILAAIALSRFTTTTSTTNTACANTAPTFSSLATAGVTNTCARSGCHVGSSPASGFDATSLTSSTSRVIARNPNGSLLYQKVNGGSMAVYTNSQINTAIFCWIQGGALP